MPDPRNQSLIAKIANAWADVPYPGDEHIFTPDSYDDEGITDYFAGTSWKGHSAAALRAHCSAIGTFFTPEAYRYWLPSYLVAAVEDPEELSQGVDYLLESLAPEADSMWAWNQKSARFKLLTAAQLSAAADVIENFAQRFDDPAHPEATLRERSVVAHLRGICNQSAA